MIVCFPVEENNGIDSKVYGHFGSAPGFVLYDTKTEELDFIDNKNMKHEHGACNPAAALAGREVDTVVVGGIGRGAIVKLSSGGISVAKSKSGVISDDVQAFINGELEMLSENMQTCSHGTHSCSH